MLPNPYSPPQAAVADLDLPPPAPRSVKLACGLILSSVALGVAAATPEVIATLSQEGGWFWLASLAVYGVTGGFTIWLVIGILEGRGWARWLMLAYLLVAWVLLGADLPADLTGEDPGSAGLDLFCIVLEVVACGLLFFGTGKRWFAELAARHRSMRAA